MSLPRWGLLGLVLLLARCMFAQPSPDAAARDWMQALAAQDGLKLGELTCDAAQAQLQNTTLLYSAIGILSGSFLGGAQPKISVDELKYQTTRNDGSSAEVKITGRVRAAVLALSNAQDVDFTMRMRQERGKWRYCGETQTAQAADRSAGPPADTRSSGQQEQATSTNCPPTATPGRVLFKDDFSSQRDSWLLSSPAKLRDPSAGRYSVRNNELILTKAETTSSAFVLEQTRLADAVYEIDMRLIKGDHNPRTFFGFVQSEGRNGLEGYTFLLYPVEGQYELVSRFAGSISTIFQQTTHVAIRRGFTCNRISITLRGADLSLRINGQNVASTRMPFTASDAGLFGFGVGTTTGEGAEAGFRNLLITSAPAQ